MHYRFSALRANGEITQRSYNQDRQLTQQTLADIIRSLVYDPIGNILSIDDGFNLHGYGYDPMSRLSSATANHYDLLYSYDKNGNRLTEEDANNNLTDYLYNPINNQLTDKQGATVKSYQYDLAGNMLNDSLHTFSYDARNQLVAIAGIASYTYNGLGQRVSKNTNNIQTHYVYDKNARLIGEYNATGQAIAETVYLFGQPIVVLKGTEAYNIHTDHLGTPRKISNQTANIIWQWQDKPFGDSNVNQDPDGDGVAFEYNLRFAGQYFDAETGLHYNYFRYYDPQTGRYITSDPIGLQGGLNTYLYALANPINFNDPLGLRIVRPPMTRAPQRNGIGTGTVLDLYFPPMGEPSNSKDNVVPLFPPKDRATDSCPLPDEDGKDPCEEWLDDLITWSLSIRLGFLQIDDLTKQAFNNSVRTFKKSCPHLASQINLL